MRISSTVSWLATLGCLLTGVASGPVYAEPIPFLNADRLDGRSVCHADNCLRAIRATQRASAASSFCSSLLAKPTAGCGPLPTFVNNCGAGSTQIVRASSACSCFIGPGTTTTEASTSTSLITSSPTITSPPSTVSDVSSTEGSSEPSSEPSSEASSGSSSGSSSAGSSSVEPSSSPPPTCPAPSTVTVVVTPTGGTPSSCDAATVTLGPTTVTVPITTTMTVTSTSEPSHSSCEQLSKNPSFDNLEGPGHLSPWSVHDSPAAAFPFIVTRVLARSVISGATVMSDGILRLQNPGGASAGFGLGQAIRPCPGRRYYLRGTFRCHGCPADTELIILLWVYRRQHGGQTWVAGLNIGRLDTFITSHQEVSIELGRGSPWVAPAIVDDADFATEMDVRVLVPAGHTGEWNVYLDNMELVALADEA